MTRPAGRARRARDATAPRTLRPLHAAARPDRTTTAGAARRGMPARGHGTPPPPPGSGGPSPLLGERRRGREGPIGFERLECWWPLLHEAGDAFGDVGVGGAVVLAHPREPRLVGLEPTAPGVGTHLA